MSDRQKAINGTKWTSFSTGLSVVLQFVQISILARLLEPAAFGIVSISTLIINFFNIFVNLGFANSIIYKQESDKNTLSTIYILNLLLGFLIFIIVFLSSPLAVAFYKEEALSTVVKLSSFNFIIVYFGQLYSFLLRKELKFKSLAIIDVVSNLVGSLITIGLAYNGYAELSLIIGQLIMAFFRSFLQIFYGRKLFTPRFHFDLKKIREHIHFGAYNVGEGLVNFFQYNIDNIIIGRLLGIKLLGFYTIAYQLAIFPGSRLNPIFLQVAYPVLAKIKDDRITLKRYYLKILDVICFINIPLLAGLFIVADDVIPLIYGPGWEQSIQLIKILIFGAFFGALSQPLSSLAYSKGKPKLVFYLNVITTIIRIPLFYLLGKYWLTSGIATAFVIGSLIHLLIKFYIVNTLIGSYIHHFITNIMQPLMFSFLMIIMIVIYRAFVKDSSSYQVIVQILLGGVVYSLLTLMFKTSLKEVKSVMKY